MDRRSLLLLLAILGFACAALFLLLDIGGSAVPLEARELVGPAPAPAIAQAQDEPAPLSGGTAETVRRGTGLAAPRLPERPALDPGRSRVAGWLRPREDKPWSEASVALLADVESGTASVLAQARCEADGGFVLDTADEGHAALLVCARGFLPRLEPLELAHGEERLFEDFELERGAEIAGTLRANTSPLARFEVVAIDQRDLPVLKLACGPLLWNGAGYDWRFTTAESGADGRYAIGGLRPGEYGVRVSTCRGPFASLCSNDRTPRNVRAPSSDADFGFESSALALHFTCEGKPLAGVEVELTSGGWSSGRKSDAHGVVSFELVPRLDCTLVATKQGYEDLRLPVSSPASGASGSESYEMRPRPPGSSVRFVVSTANEEAPPDLRVRLSSRDAAGDEVLLRDASLHCTRASARAEVKEFVLEDAPPGRYSAVLLPGQPWNNDLDPQSYIGTHCAVELQLDIPQQGELRQSVWATRRPALRMLFQDANGEKLPANCTLRNEAGEELRIVLVDPAQGVPLVGHQLSTLGPTLVYSTLGSGSVHVEVEYEGRTLYSGTRGLLPGQILEIAGGR